MTTEIWYRYEDYDYEVGLLGQPSKALILLREFEVLRTTPKGVWLKMGVEQKRFVLRDAIKRYACPTKEEARISFIARKEKQLKIVKDQVIAIESALAQAKDETKELVPTSICNSFSEWLDS